MNDLMGKEVYVITDSIDFEMADTVIVGGWNELLQNLQKCDPTICNETQVFHGYITPAMTLPANLKGKSAFVLIYDPDDNSKAVVFESPASNVKSLALEIEEIVQTNGDTGVEVEIDDIYILYGYQLNVGLSVSEEEVDEELLDVCSQIAKEVIGE